MDYSISNDYEKMFKHIVSFTCQYLKEFKIQKLVIGMSGGIDSALTAALASEVCLRNEIELYGRVINIRSKHEEIGRGMQLSYLLCNNFSFIDMTNVYNEVIKNVIDTPNSTENQNLIRQGNIKARLRMIKLYDLARRLNGIVLSTDNFTEYLLGFWTLHGDVGDYGMLQNLWKTEVYGLANYMLEKYKKEVPDNKSLHFWLEDCIKATPTDGLGITDSDFDQIYPEYDKNASAAKNYNIIDKLLLQYLNGDNFHKDSKVIQRYLKTSFKRANPFNISRDMILA